MTAKDYAKYPNHLAHNAREPWTERDYAAINERPQPARLRHNA